MSAPDFLDLRSALDRALNGLSAIGRERGFDRLYGQTLELVKKLDEERFVVAVLGEFKRGKSTFINALVGAELLPMGAVPLTSVVTSVVGGANPRAEVAYRDGTRTEIDPRDLFRYVTEKHNPGNVLGVDQVVVEHPVAGLSEGVELVDTPGVGSIHGHNTETTRSFLSRVDVAIFVTSAEQPVSEAERAFLKEVRSEAERMFFVLNKVDLLDPDDAAEVLEFTRRVLTEAVGRQVEVYPISARKALQAKTSKDGRLLEESGLALFERDFRDYLTAEKDLTLLASVAASAQAAATDEINALLVEEQSLRLPVDELNRRLAALEEVHAAAVRSRRDLDALLAMETAQLLSVVEEDLRELRRRETERLLAYARELIEAHPNPRSAADEVDGEVKAALQGAVDRWRTVEEDKVQSGFRHATKRFTVEADELIRRTLDLCSNLMEVNLGFTKSVSPGDLESEFTYAFFDPPGAIEADIEAVRRKLPKPLARRMLLRKFEGKIPVLVDKHCGRLRYDFARRLQQSRERLIRELNGQLDSILDSLRSGMERARDRREESESLAASAGSDLVRVRARLEAIARTLADIRRAAGS